MRRTKINYNKQIVRLRELMRRVLRLFNCESNREREYSFALRHVVGKDALILDVGGSESLLPLYFARQGLHVVVYDYRVYMEHHSNITHVNGDFLKNKLHGKEFDYVVMISTIEHIGFGSYGAPKFKDGDIIVMSEVKRVLKKEGKLIITFPFTGKHKIIQGFERWYDADRTNKLFEGMHVLAEEYYIPNRKLFGRWINFAPASLEEIQKVEQETGCQGCACFVVSQQPRTKF